MTTKAAQRSIELFDSGYCCAESILLAVAEDKGIESDLIPKIATGFCSGMARTSNQCGAVSGGILAINLFTGRSSPEESHEENYAFVKEFLSAFEKNFGSINCQELTSCDLSTTEGQAFYQENHINKKCQTLIGGSTRLVLDMI
ncbi:MAG: C-GCAxxG-C-C family protein [Anaerolineales bacterium]|jgi:C_GCAxxG_C_C family probable redox protein